MNNTVGQRIRYFRTQRRMSQEDLARAIGGREAAYIGHLERGLKSPTITTLDKIVKVFDITYCEFFDDDIDIDDTESRKFYIDIIRSCLRRISDENLKIVADIVMKITDLTK